MNSGISLLSTKKTIRLSSMLKNIPTPQSLNELSTCHLTQEIIKVDQLLLDIATQYGLPFSFLYEQNGQLVQNLFPVKADASSQISSSSLVELELHTETAFHRYRPDYVFLFCVRADKSAGTILVFLSDILGQLDRSTKSVLKTRSFRTLIDPSFMTDSKHIEPITTSILSEDEQSIVYDRNLMYGVDDESIKALNILNSIIDKSKSVLTLQDGDVLVINNHQTIHGRTRFMPRYDGTDRWIKRIMISTKNLNESDDVVPNGAYQMITSIN